MSLHDQVNARLRALFDGAYDQRAALNEGLRLLGKWRSVLIANTLLENNGSTVMQGPLKGLDFLSTSAEGCYVAKILGCYEQPLQPFIEMAFARQYSTVINVGCAEGYYAVGMAKRMPRTEVHAFDLDVSGQSKCAELAEKNSVQDRVVVGGEFHPSDFAHYTSQSVLLMCDIEGGLQLRMTEFVKASGESLRALALTDDEQLDYVLQVITSQGVGPERHSQVANS